VASFSDQASFLDFIDSSLQQILPGGYRPKSKQRDSKMPAHFLAGQNESSSKIQQECLQLQKILQLLSTSFSRDEGLSREQI